MTTILALIYLAAVLFGWCLVRSGARRQPRRLWTRGYRLSYDERMAEANAKARHEA